MKRFPKDTSREGEDEGPDDFEDQIEKLVRGGQIPRDDFEQITNSMKKSKRVGQTASFLKSLRRKYRLGEFKSAGRKSVGRRSVKSRSSSGRRMARKARRMTHDPFFLPTSSSGPNYRVNTLQATTGGQVQKFGLKYVVGTE